MQFDLYNNEFFSIIMDDSSVRQTDYFPMIDNEISVDTQH